MLDEVGAAQELENGRGQRLGKTAKNVTCIDFGFWLFLTLSVVVFWWIHDAPSFLTDDAIYSLFAERTLHEFQQSGFAGLKVTKYFGFLNAFAFWAFGEQLVSLRYPLVLVMIVLVTVTYCCLRPVDRFDAWIASAVMLTLSVAQFVNPAASWYAIAIAMLVVLLLQSTRTLSWRRALIVGVLVGVCYFIRQPSGAVLGAGVVLTALVVLSKAERSNDCLVARALLSTVFVVLAFISSKSGTVGSWLLLGLGPLIITVVFFVQIRVKNSTALAFAIWFSIGFLLASVPIVLLQLRGGSLLSWGNAIVVSPMSFDWSSFNPGAALSIYFVSAMEGVLAKPGVFVFVNAIFWLCLITAPAILSWHLARQALAGKLFERNDLAFPLIALLLSVGLLQFQMLAYIFFVSPICLVALLVIVRDSRRTVKLGIRAMCVFLVSVGLVAHAGKPFPVTVADYLAGERTEGSVLCPMSRSGLRMAESECKTQLYLLQRIESFVPPGSAILTLPNEIEINFLADVDQALPFYNCAMGIKSPRDKDAAVVKLKESLPALLVVNTASNYYSELCKELVSAIGSSYKTIDSPTEYEVHLRTDLWPTL